LFLSRQSRSTQQIPAAPVVVGIVARHHAKVLHHIFENSAANGHVNDLRRHASVFANNFFNDGLVVAASRVVGLAAKMDVIDGHGLGVDGSGRLCRFPFDLHRTHPQQVLFLYPNPLFPSDSCMVKVS
jgi:hypothetical protein